MPLPINEDIWNNLNIVFSTKFGMIRKNKLIDVAKSGTRDLRDTGKLSIKLTSNDELVNVKLATQSDDVILSSSNGKCFCF